MSDALTSRDVPPAAARGPLPSGTVTFLFSDIEGSTERWDRYRAEMQEALRKHDALLHAAVESHSGYVFKTVGDEFCTVFHTVADAAAAALEIQRSIARDDWSNVEGLRVRVAVHTGVTDERNGDYYGPTVNRVARLLAVAHGEQVVFSGVAADLAQGLMPPQSSLRDLGLHRLKDLANPEQVYQLVAPDLRADFPPLRSLDALPNNLPLQLTTFVGRDETIAEIKGLLERSRIVTLVGTGGIGKTRTALQVAADLLDGSGDGVWCIELAPLADPSLVTTAISAALGVSPPSDKTALEALLAHLRTRQLLIVLDNCEHVVTEAARVADAIIRNAPHVRLIATSREGLNVTGEYVYRMPSLSVPPAGVRLTGSQAMGYGAVALFNERAYAADGRFAVSDENATAVGDICRRLDGIALAIELAAPRVKVLAVQQLAQRLDERFRILTGGSRSALPRQQTMRALIDWSYDLLSDDEREIFRRCSVFAGGWTIDAASEICADERIESWDVLDLLSALVDKSLVATELQGSSQRYRLLESMRQYARERLGTGDDATAVHRRHAAHFCDVARRAEGEWDTSAERAWLERLLPEIDNFRAALTWSIVDGNDPVSGAEAAAALFRVFDRLALNDEGVGWLDRALAAAAGSNLLEARIEAARSFLLGNSMRIRPAAAASERAIALFRTTDDESGLTDALMRAARLFAIAQNDEAALSAGQEALTRARSAGDRLVTARTLYYTAAALDAASVERAREMFAESVALFRSLGRELERGNALGWWAELEAKMGCYDRAVELVLEGLTFVTGTYEANHRSNLAGYLVALGDVERARPAARDALRLALERRISDIAATAIGYLAVIAAHDGDLEQAARLAGYSDARVRALEVQFGSTEQVPRDRLSAQLLEHFGESEMQRLLNEGGDWGEERAIAEASKV